MYRLIIIDDEERVREGLAEFVNWEELGFNLVATFASSEEAMIYLSSNKVDVILTDIIMPPGKTGLELIKELNDTDNGVIKLVLSGHTEFRYAKQAIKLGAKGFLTKPVDFSELNELFLGVASILEEKDLDEKKKLLLEQSAIDDFVLRLVTGKYSSLSDILREVNDSGLKIEEHRGVLLRIRIRFNTISETPLHDKTISQVLKSKWIEEVGKYTSACGFENDRNELVLMIRDFDSYSRKIIESIAYNLEVQYDVVFFIGLAVYQSLVDLEHAYLKTMHALSYRIILGKYVEFQEVRNNTKEIALLDEVNRNNIIDLLHKKEIADLNKFIYDILHNAINHEGININVVFNNCIDLLLLLNNYLIVHYSSKVIEESMTVLSQSLYRSDSFEELYEKNISYFERAYELLSTRNERNSGRIIEEIKVYINDHCEEAITLQMMADMKYIHPIYLSKLFKEKAGCNFLEYLTNVRIEKSKSLLRDVSYKIYQVSEMVGYESPKYFSKLFKNQTGVTPKEYRNSMR